MSMTTTMRHVVPQTLADLETLVSEGGALGPFEGRGSIERSRGYRMLLGGFVEGRHALAPHPEDADAFMKGRDGTVCFWLLRHAGRRCVVRRCAVSDAWIVVRTSDIHHTRVAREFRRTWGSLRATLWQRTDIANTWHAAASAAAPALAARSPALTLSRLATQRQQREGAVERARARLRAHHARYGEVIDHLEQHGAAGNSQLAQRLGVKEATLAVIQHRARKRLLAFVREELQGNEPPAPSNMGERPDLLEALCARVARHQGASGVALAGRAAELCEMVASLQDLPAQGPRGTTDSAYPGLPADLDLALWKALVRSKLEKAERPSPHAPRSPAERRGMGWGRFLMSIGDDVNPSGQREMDLPGPSNDPWLGPAGQEGAPRARSATRGAASHELEAYGSDASRGQARTAPSGRIHALVTGSGLPSTGAPRPARGLLPGVVSPEPMAAAAVPLRNPRRTVLLAAFDSAWTASGQGALTIMLAGPAGAQVVVEPHAAGFDDALRRVEAVASTAPGLAQVVIAIDQPIVVPNASGRRPVDVVASRVAQRVQSATQPANRSRAGMFDDEAPVWAFIAALRKRWPDLSLDPGDIREGGPAAVVVEVYPLLGLLGLLPGLFQRGELFRYNPARTAFRIEDWATLCGSLARALEQVPVPALASTCDALARIPCPTKRDHDRLDSVICALLGLHWVSGAPMGVVGDVERGYMVFPANEPLLSVLRDTARAEGVDLRELAPQA